MTMKSLFEVQNTNNSELGCLSDCQQYRTLLAKVIQFFVSPEKCENRRYKVLTPDRDMHFLTFI